MAKIAYHSRDPVLGYNAIINYIVFERGTGKSFAYKHFVISKFLENGAQFVYLRRYKNELKLVKNEFFNDLINHFPNHKFAVKGRYCMIDDKIAGYMYPLSTGADLKSIPLPEVEYLIYDEIIPEGTYRDYLPDEFSLFQSAISSIFRKRKIRIFMLGNKVSSITPYQVGHNIPPFDRTWFDKKRRILVYLDKTVAIDFSDKNRTITDFETIFSGTKYFNYSVKNETLVDEKTFVAKRPKDSILQFLLNVAGVWYGVYYASQGRIFFDDNCDKTFPIRVMYDLDNLKECELLYDRKTNYAKIIKVVLQNGGLYYANARVKIALQDFIRHI